MLASQLIYTSWENGNLPNKGFMIYSKSADVSDEDANAITKNMRYETLPHLPFDPSYEEIELLFPKNLSFFRLPSGKLCLAQATYIGHHYIESDKRLGNYIIHALILDEIGDIVPMRFVDSEIFKRSLTQSEAKAASPVPPLPKIDIENQNLNISLDEITSFLTGQRMEVFKSLLQCVINSTKDDNPVYLYDEIDKLKLWFKALSIFIPESLLKKITFDTYSFHQKNLNINCIQPKLVQFNYAIKLNEGKSVFEMVGGIIKSAPFYEYVFTAVDLFSHTVNQLPEFVELIDALIGEGVDIECATDLYNISRENFSRFDFTSAGGTKRVIDALDATKNHPAFICDCAFKVYNHLQNCNIENKEGLQLERVLFCLGDRDLKKRILEKGFAQILDAPILDETLESYAKRMKEIGTFSWQDFLGFIDDYEKLIMLRKRTKRLEKNYLLTDILCDLSIKHSTKPYAAIVSSIFDEECDEANSEFLDAFFARALPIFGASLSNMVRKKLQTIKISTASQARFAFSLLARTLEFYEDFNLSLISILSNINQEILEQYCLLSKKHPSVLASFESKQRQNPMLQMFFIERQIMDALSKELDKDELVSYYKNVYVKGFDRQKIFFKRLSEYLDKHNDSNIQGVLALYLNLNAVLGKIDNEVFNLFAVKYLSAEPKIQLERLKSDYEKDCRAFLSDYKERKKNLDKEIEFFISAAQLFFATKNKDNKALAKLTEQVLKGELFDTKNLDENTLHKLVSLTLEDIVVFYSSVVLSSVCDSDCLKCDFAHALFLPLYNAKEFSFLLAISLERTNEFLGAFKAKNSAKMSAAIEALLPLIMLSASKNEEAARLASAIKLYFKLTNRKARQALYDGICQMVDKKESEAYGDVRQFALQCMEDSKGFFEKLFKK